MSGAKLRAVHAQHGAPVVAPDHLGVERMPEGTPLDVRVCLLDGLVLVHLKGQGGFAMRPEDAWMLGARIMGAARSAGGVL